MNRLAIGLLAGALALGSLAARAETRPKLSMGSGQPACAEALRLARAVFDSPASRLYAPPAVPADLPSTLILQPEALDISGGNALRFDPAYLDKLPIGERGERGYLYWQKQPLHGKRLVVTETSFSWQGALYSLSLLDETVGPGTLMAEVMSDRPTMGNTLVSESWRPPLLLRNNQTGQYWAVDVGQPYEVLGAWKVYVTGVEGIACGVQFGPEVSDATTLLPPEVRRLAQLLDETLGSGDNEGTLLPTSALRLAAAHTWANVALRPWGLGEPYNSRQEVETGLAEWADESAANRHTYQSIQRQYPVAEAALFEYYQRNFQRSAVGAKRLATAALDIAFRAHFAFSQQ